MAIPDDVRSQWYKALSKEDSLKVMELLKGHRKLGRKLLEVGWGSEVSESPAQDQERKKRTALHVGVKTGNVNLVEEVLFLCNVKAVVDKRSRMKEHGGGDPPSTNWRDLIDRADVDETHKNEEITAGPSKKDTTSEGDRQPTGTRLQKAVLGSDPEPAQKSSSSNSSPGKKRHLRSLSTGDGQATKLGSTEKIGQSAEKIGLKRTKSSASLVADPKQEDKDNTFLRRLLIFQDGEYELDAIAIAALHGNREIFLLLLHAMGKTKFYDVYMPGRTPPLDINRDNEEDRRHRAKLREATEKLVYDWGHRATLREAKEKVVYDWSQRGKLSGFADKRTVVRCLEGYEKHPDFNFLPWEEYLFHFLFTRAALKGLSLAKALWKEVMLYSDSTCRFLLELQDGQGRTPLHVAVDEDRVPGFFKCIFTYSECDKDVVECAMAALDGAGRTALHRGMATGTWDASKLGSGKTKVNVMPLVHSRWKHLIPDNYHNWTGSKFPVNMLSSENGFKGTLAKEALRKVQSNPFCTAILHGQADVVRNTMRCAMQSLSMVDTNGMNGQADSVQNRMHYALESLSMVDTTGMDERYEIKFSPQQRLQIGKCLRFDLLCPYSWEQGDRGHWEMDSRIEQGERGRWEMDLDAVELAALLGDVRIVELLPLTQYNSNSESTTKRTKQHRPWPALHIAANAGNYKVLKLFLDDPFCDPYEKDWQGNTALHHALNVITIGEFQPHLLDYINWKHIKGTPERGDPRKKEKKEIVDNDPLIDRQGCINLLLEAGCDVFKMNQDGQPPYPKGQLNKNSVFRSWWYERQGKEFEATQTTLRSAANAIAVTATLVATASYVGPLTPPMGLAGDPFQIQEANLWVRVFIFCDTMSFYCAIIAIILSLLPSLPMPEQHMKDEVRRTRGMVTMSLIALFPSVICVLVAFVSSSIAVVSANVTSTGGSLTITTASIGGFFCLVAFILFLVRLLAFILPGIKPIRIMYNATNGLIAFG